jgi:hypothetical protein
MDLELQATPESPPPTGLATVHGPDAIPQTLALIARLSMNGWPVWVVDGGNRFDALWVANCIARHDIPPEEALARIRVSRAFTCHQFTERVLSLPEEEAGQGVPLVLLYPLDTYYDEDVPLEEARRLLNRLWPVLRRRSRAVPVILALRPPRSGKVADRMVFFDTCLRLADYQLGPGAAAEDVPLALPFPQWNMPRPPAPPAPRREGG